MNAVYFFLFTCFFFHSVAGQTVIALNDQEGQKIYCGFNNQVSIMAEETDCSLVAVYCDNGTIQKSGDCRYLINPARNGSVNLTITAIKNGKIKWKKKALLLALPFPKPVANVGGFINRDTVAAAAFKAQSGVAAWQPCCGLDLKYSVTGFSISIVQANQIIFTKTVTGNMFIPAIRDALQQLHPDDHVIIYNIAVIGEDNKIHVPNPLEYVIK